MTKPLLCLLIIGTLNSGALSAQTNHQKTHLSPLNQRLWACVSHTGLVQIEGEGRLWKKTTGLSEGFSLHVRDKKLMYALLKRYSISNKRVSWKKNSAPDKQGSIFVNFMPNEYDINGETIESLRVSFPEACFVTGFVRKRSEAQS